MQRIHEKENDQKDNIKKQYFQAVSFLLFFLFMLISYYRSNEYINFILMATLTNTIRWARRGNSQIRNKSTSLIDTQAEAFKLPALNALNKSIKYGDLSFATSRDLRKLRKQPDQIDNIEEVSAHQNLMVIRKKYDNMSKTREALQQTVDDMQQKREKLDSQKHRFQQEKQGGGEKVKHLEESLNSMKLHSEETDMDRKVLLSMMERLKSDRIVHDLRRYKLQKELTYIQKQKQIILKENAGKLEEEDKTKKIHQKLLEHLQAEQAEREAHIDSLQTMIAQKVTLNENSELRRSQMQQIAQNTLQDKDLKQKNWYKVYLCTRFVQRLLRDKMTREMLKFNTVEVAFKNIKTATGVGSTIELVNKFLNKEHAYGGLLGKIADNQRNIVELKTQHQELVKERRKLETEQDELNSNRIQSKDLTREEKELHATAERAANCKLLMEKLGLWSAKTIKKFNSLENTHQEVEVKENPKEIIAQIKTYLQKINQSVEQVAIVEQKSPQLKVDLGSNNCRIQLNPKQQHLDQNPKKQFEQDDFVSNQRSEILKNNDKFMKQLKKKYDDIKKAKIDAQPKKKEVVPQKPKPQPVQS